MNTSLLDWLILILFGLPALALAAICSAVGIYFRKPRLLLIGALISGPPAFYLGSTPMFRYIGYALPLFHALAAYALFKKRIWLAIIILFPYIAALCYLLGLLILQ